MPFLVPLLLQVALGYPPLQAGLMMLPVAVAGMLVKGIATPLITRYGYRRILVLNTLAVGLSMASFALVWQDQPLWLRIAPLAFFGAVNSLQFTAMNKVTLKDLGHSVVSSGNSLLSMVQMLALGMGVVGAGAVLAAFTGFFGIGVGATGSRALPAFHATLVCMGLITVASTGIFWQLWNQEQPGPVAAADGPNA